MDFSKFRASGDLSDITVCVDGQEAKLHKFPLYARSDYFCELARSQPTGEPEVSYVELRDFPGGSEIFDQVADFCYNMPVNITKNNAVAVRCATEYLKMGGAGNLMGVAHSFIADSISTSKIDGSTAGPVAMLMDCNGFGDISKSAGIVDLCIDALIECWRRPSSSSSSSKLNSIGTGSVFSKVPLRSSKFNEIGASSSAFTKVHNQTNAISGHNSSNSNSGRSVTEKLDEVSINCLISIRADWFAEFLTTAKDRGVALPDLGHLAVRYVTAAMDKDLHGKNGHVGGPGFSPGAEEEKEEEDVEESEKTKPKPNSHRSEKETDETEAAAADGSVGGSSHHSATSGDQVDVGRVLDQVILVLPEQAYNIPAVTMDWLTKVLRIATTRGCECRGHLVRVAGEMLTHLGPEELCVISPSVLHDIVVDASPGADDQGTAGQTSSGKGSGHSERACRLVDTYLGQMSAKGVLTSETFRLLVAATKDNPRATHDNLYAILESVFKAEKDKLSPTQRQELVELVNFDLLSEPNLQRALDEGVAPSDKIAGSALKLCSRLRSELASVKYIAEMQEEDIQKYQTVAAASVTSSLRPVSPSHGAEPRHFTALSARERNIDSGFADILEPSAKSPTAEHEPSDSPDKPDALRAAQSVLTAARHKLSVPMYTGYRPALLTRLGSPSDTTSGQSGHAHHSARSASTVEHDISLEEELEFKFDRTFRSLDPRVRHQRLNLRDHPAHHAASHAHSHHHNHHNHHHNPHSGQRSYFPYSSSSYRH